MGVRKDGNPYSNFNFIVEVNGAQIAAFSEVSGLDSEITTIEYREGADKTNAMRQLPGVERYTNVELSRGIVGDSTLWDWHKEARDGGSSFPARRESVTIKLLNETHDDAKPAMAWTLTNAWPTKISGPTLSAKGDEIAIEKVILAFERMDVSV